MMILMVESLKVEENEVLQYQIIIMEEPSVGRMASSDTRKEMR